MRPIHALALGALATLTLGPTLNASPLLEAEQLNDGPISDLAFLVGDFRVEQTSYNPDGTAAEESDSGVVKVRPALGGGHLMMVTTDEDEADDDIALWLITWHDDRAEYIGSVFSGGDPDSGTFRGPLADGVLTLTGDPFELPDGRTLSFRVTMERLDSGDIFVTLDAAMNDQWFTRSKSTWRRAGKDE